MILSLERIEVSIRIIQIKRYKIEDEAKYWEFMTTI